MRAAQIGDRAIPTDGEVYVIAEAGVNHNGDIELAHRLVDVAKESGSDAVKFQTFDPAKLVSSAAAATPYQRERGAADQRSLLESLTLPQSAWAELQAHAAEQGITFLSTPFDLDSAELLASMQLPAMKVSSGELTNLPYLRALSQLGVTLLVSTGMGSADEVAAAVDACGDAPGLILFHCVSAYPAPIEQCNLRAIQSMIQTHQVPVGWSDHTPGNVTAIASVALGASILEKHFTLDRTLPGPDHVASLEPAELASYVSNTKAAARALGDGVKRRVPAEEENAALVRRSWHAARDLAPGTVLSLADLHVLRPETGVPPTVNLLGFRVTTAIAAGAPVLAESVER